MGKAAYCGVEGAYAHIASEIMLPDARKIPFRTFSQAYRAAETGECRYAVLPVENNCAGEVGAVMDLIFEGSLYINAMLELPVNHALVALKSSSESLVRTVVSHPQALEQCAGFIARHGYETRSFSNTAAAAQFVRDSADVSLAAIASKETAERFGLKILREDINDISGNATKFAALSKEKTSGRNGFILVFTVENEAGALAQALDMIGSFGFNLRSIHSRPMKTLEWEYYFYAEAQGDIGSEKGREMLRALSGKCRTLKTAGTY